MEIFKYLRKNKWIVYIVSLFLVSRFIQTILGIASYELLQPFHGSEYKWNYTSNKIIDVWGLWDTGYYLDIAMNGYSTKLGTSVETVDQANYAFFPLYPILIRILTVITKNYLLSGILISNLSIFFAGIFLYLLVKNEFGGKIAINSVKFLFFFPTSFVFTSAYTEALFLLLTVSAFYYLKQKKVLVSSFLGLFSALTRSLGVLLIIPFFIEIVEKFKKDKMINVLKLLLIPFGLLLFMFYLKQLTGDYLAFAKIQQSWGRELGNPITHLINGFRSNLIQHQFTSWFTLIALILTMLTFLYLEKIYSIFAFYTILVPLSTGITSMPRFTLVAFPIFILLAIFSEKSEVLDAIIIYTMLIVQGVMLVFWTGGFDLLM